MRRTFQLLLIAAFPLLFTSCFEITEEVNMKSNGSGDMLLTINMSQSKENLKNYMQMEEIEGFEIPSKAEIESEIAKVRRTLSKIEGLSNIKINSDFEEFIFKVSGNFDNVKTLNKAVNKVADALNQTPFPTIKKDNFDYQTGKFTRYFKYLSDLDLTKEEYEGLHFTARFIMESAKYISVYRFDRPVKKVANTQAQISPNKKAVKMESNFADIVTGTKSIENEITF